MNQLREDATLQVNGFTSTSTAVGGVNAYAEDSIIRFRDANVWIEHDTLGRLTVGHLTNPGPQGIIDLGGTAVAAPVALSLMGGAFIFRTSDGKFTGATISNNTDNVADFSHRTDSIRWDSPTVAGFVLSAAIGEAATVDRAPGGIVSYNPVLYGEYAKGTDLQATFSNSLSLTNPNNSNEYTMWGLGVVQNIDAAAMELYITYRRHSLDRDPAGGAALAVSGSASCTNGSACATGLPTTSVSGAGRTDLEDIHIVYGGMRIAF